MFILSSLILWTLCWTSVGSTGSKVVCVCVFSLGTFVGSLNSSQNKEALSHMFTGAHVGWDGKKKSSTGSGFSEGVRAGLRCVCEQWLWWWNTLESWGGWNKNQLELLDGLVCSSPGCRPKSDNSRRSSSTKHWREEKWLWTTTSAFQTQFKHFPWIQTFKLVCTLRVTKNVNYIKMRKQEKKKKRSFVLMVFLSKCISFLLF